jgi:anti-sigma factor RsiW
MNGTESDLMRLLHGELPEARARELRARLEREPALAEEYRRLRQAWEGLALPPASPVPPGFAQRVMARARADARTESLSLRGAPGWVRAVAAAALVAGTVLGIGVGGRLPLGDDSQASAPRTLETQSQSNTSDTSDTDAPVDDSLAGSYWDALEGLQ